MTTARPVDDLLDAIDITDPAWHAAGGTDPVFALLRAHRPVERRRRTDGRPFWSLTRHAEADEVLRDPGTFSSEYGLVVDEIRHDGPDPSADRVLEMCRPAAHRDLRPQMAPTYSPRAAHEAEDGIRAVVVSVLDGLAGRDGFDVATDLAAPVAAGVVLRLLGIPEEGWPLVRELVEQAEDKGAPLVAGRPFRSRREEANHHLLRYLMRLTADGTERIGGHVGMLAGCRTVHGAPLGRMDVALNALALVDAGYGTTRHATTGAVLALVEHPDQVQRVLADPALLPRLSEEVVRWFSPIRQLSRVATREVELGGAAVAPGEIVTVWLGSANRDETVFADPDRIDVGRRVHRHLGYAVGPHLCLGMHLARTLLRVLVSELVTRLPPLRRDGPIRWLASNNTAGITRLPVAVTGPAGQRAAR